MATHGNRNAMYVYVTPEVYQFFEQEKGLIPMSKYVGGLLGAYVDAVKSGEIPEDVNVN